MEAVAAAASVGKGTVFRRFGDRVGLMRALLDHAEREYQEAFLLVPLRSGPVRRRWSDLRRSASRPFVS